MNLDLRVIARSGYTLLDWVSDVGGMQGMLISLIVFLLSIWNFNQFDNFMVHRLFKSVHKDNSLSEQTKGEKAFLDASQLQNLREYGHDCLPGCLQRRKCCRKSHRDKAFSKGRRKLSDETSIIEIIRQLRFTRKAMAILLKRNTIQKIEELSRYKFIELNSNSDESPKEGESGNDLSLSEI